MNTLALPHPSLRTWITALSLGVLLSASSSLMAANRVTVADIEVEPSSTDQRLPVMLEIDQNSHGVQLAISYDPAVIEITGLDTTTGVLSTALWAAEMIVQADGEMVFGAIVGLDLDGGTFDDTQVITSGSDLLLGELVFNVLADADTTTTIAFENNLPGFLNSDPPLSTANKVTDPEGAPVELDLDSATITIQTTVDPEGFRRGDVDGNGNLEITDAINNLSFQFLGTYNPPCFDACDFDDNGRIELTDPIANLSHQFLGQAPPAPPGKDTCGEDPTPDELGCDTPPTC